MQHRTFRLGLCAFVCWLCLWDTSVAGKRIDHLLYLVESASEKRDGEMGFAIDGALVELIIIAPEEVLSWLPAKERIVTELLGRWQYTVFTDQGDPGKHEELQQLRATLINSLRQCTCSSEASRALSDKMLQDLSSIQIRHID
jgi:hypothetical protein